MDSPPCPLASTPKEDLTSAQYWDDEWCVDTATVRLGSIRAKRHPLPTLMARLLDQRGNGPTDILEVGCAPGTILSQFYALRPHDRFHGVDFSHLGLMQTKQLLARRNMKVELHQADVRDFAPGQRYGLVYSCGLIEHFTDPAEILKHHVRLCAPDGFVVVSVPNYAGRLQRWIIHQLEPEALKAHNLEIMKAEALGPILEMAGLKGIVAGCAGPHLIRSRATRRSVRAKVIRRLAQTWNLVNMLGPNLSPRGSVIWAYGRAA